MRLYLVAILCLIVNLSLRAEGKRVTCQMNTDWGFYLGDLPEGSSTQVSDAEFQAISLPHIMRLEPKNCGGNTIYQGTGWYRRYFNLDTSLKDRNVYLEFEGVMKNCDVFINGQQILKHYGGYMGFEVDVTPYVHWERSNLLELKVVSEDDPQTPPGKPQGKLDFYYYSGIYRDVSLVYKKNIQITNPLSANKEAGGGIFVTYPEVSRDKAIVSVKTQIANRSAESVSALLVQKLIDNKGKTVAQSEKSLEVSGRETKDFTQRLMVMKPHLWHPYSPYLYTLKTEILKDGKVTDDETTNVGIRTIRQTKEGFFINGEKLYLRGTNRHQCFPNVGDAVSNSMHERDALYIKQGGYNAVRAAHYTHDPAFLDACDKYGLLVIECIPGWQFWNDDSIFAKRLYEVEREMIRRDRNHPSIFLWETMLNESFYPKSVADSIHKIAHAEFPGDQMYTVGDYWGHQDVADCFDVYYKQVSKFPPDGDVMTNIPQDMINIAASYAREWGAGVGIKPRSSLTESESDQVRQCQSRIDALNGHGYFDWCMLDANPTVAGHFSWSFNDYPRGLANLNSYNGAVDLNRFPKFSFYMLQSMRNPHISQPGLYEGPMVKIASYNQSADMETSAKEIWVFSNCDSVTLYRNDRRIGTITRQEASQNYLNIVIRGGSPAFRFLVNGYEAGTLRAVAYLDGKVSCEDEVTTASSPHHLKIILPDCGIQPIADGSDMIPVWIEVVDQAGNRVSDSSQQIHLSVTGEGSLIGKDNDHACIENQQVEGGVGSCFIRTSRKAGKILIKAEAPGLEAGEYIIKSRRTRTRQVQDDAHQHFTAAERVDAGGKSTDEVDLQSAKRLTLSRIIVPYADADTKYPYTNINDGNNDTYWISPSGELPQVVTLELDKPANVNWGRIKFQKDSSKYQHRVEVSSDGNTWQELFTRESTGWDLKPFRVGCTMRLIRITFLSVSEGNPGLAEVTLFE